jgi:GH25 family lysozyme M1 (1,4-beta-N-acetylmuramidase)
MGVTPDDLICLDFENSSRHGDRNMTAAEAQQWIDIVEAALGGKVCVYGSNLLTDALQANHAAFPGRPFWPARYDDSPPDLPGNRQWAIWQFTDKGHPYPDMNRFPGTVAELQATWPRLRT